MNRLIGTVTWLLVGIILLPVVARAAQALVPVLLSVIAFLAIARLAWPTRRRR